MGLRREMNDGYFENLDPHEIEVIHARNRPLRDLIDSMQEDGWQGRPLLVIEAESGFVA